MISASLRACSVIALACAVIFVGCSETGDELPDAMTTPETLAKEESYSRLQLEREQHEKEIQRIHSEESTKLLAKETEIDNLNVELDKSKDSEREKQAQIEQYHAWIQVIVIATVVLLALGLLLGMALRRTTEADYAHQHLGDFHHDKSGGGTNTGGDAKSSDLRTPE